MLVDDLNTQVPSGVQTGRGRAPLATVRFVQRASDIAIGCLRRAVRRVSVIVLQDAEMAACDGHF